MCKITIFFQNVTLIILNKALNPNYAIENLLRLEATAKYTASLLFEV